MNTSPLIMKYTVNHLHCSPSLFHLFPQSSAVTSKKDNHLKDAKLLWSLPGFLNCIVAGHKMKKKIKPRILLSVWVLISWSTYSFCNLTELWDYIHHGSCTFVADTCHDALMTTHLFLNQLIALLIINLHLCTQLTCWCCPCLFF